MSQRDVVAEHIKHRGSILEEKQRHCDPTLVDADGELGHFDEADVLWLPDYVRHRNWFAPEGFSDEFTTPEELLDRGILGYQGFGGGS